MKRLIKIPHIGDLLKCADNIINAKNQELISIYICLKKLVKVINNKKSILDLRTYQ